MAFILIKLMFGILLAVINRSKYLLDSFDLSTAKVSSAATGCFGIGSFLFLSKIFEIASSQNFNRINAILLSDATKGILASSTLKALNANASLLASSCLIKSVHRKFS